MPVKLTPKDLVQSCRSPSGDLLAYLAAYWQSAKSLSAIPAEMADDH